MPSFSFAAAILGFISVALGAFGAHGLKDRFTDLQMGWWQTATLYLLVHAAVLLFAGQAYAVGSLRFGQTACVAFLVGCLIFPGSLYLMALTDMRWLGAITPIGGLGFLVGWAALAASYWRV
jgi:uncharacterized membrane protein YgdD (TMEM256/DUF423 family)